MAGNAPADDRGAAPKAAPDEPSFGELVSTERADDVAAHRAAAQQADLIAPWLPISWKVAITGATLCTIVAIPSFVPLAVLSRLQVLDPSVSFFPDETDDDAPVAGMAAPVETVGELSLPGPTDDGQSRASELDKLPSNPRGPIGAGNAIPAAVLEDKPPIDVDNLSANGLDKFFDKLIAVESKQAGAVARVLYFGDSIVASDFITGKLRRLLQDRFGDAGHGYAIAANAYAGWFHIDVSRKSSEQWKTSRCIGPFAEDGLYGLGCVSFTARKPDEWFSMGTADLDKWGRSVSKFELEYLEQPDGGELDLVLDGEKHSSLSTAGNEKKLKYHVVSVPDGPHKLEVRSTSDKPTRLFGMRMERDVNGATLSALGITGARARFLDKQDDAHWAEVLKAAKPDLVVLAFGTNEVGDGTMAFDEQGQLSKDPMGDYERNLKKVMEQVMKAVPEASWMLVGPPDMASKKDGGSSKPMVPRLVEHQLNCAKELGWPFWNQYKAMGGSGSMWSWVQAGLGNPDMVHPTGSGGNKLGKMQYLALMKAYEDYKERKR